METCVTLSRVNSFSFVMFLKRFALNVQLGAESMRKSHGMPWSDLSRWRKSKSCGSNNISADYAAIEVTVVTVDWSFEAWWLSHGMQCDEVSEQERRIVNHVSVTCKRRVHLLFLTRPHLLTQVAASLLHTPTASVSRAINQTLLTLSTLAHDSILAGTSS